MKRTSKQDKIISYSKFFEQLTCKIIGQPKQKNPSTIIVPGLSAAPLSFYGLVCLSLDEIPLDKTSCGGLGVMTRASAWRTAQKSQKNFMKKRENFSWHFSPHTVQWMSLCRNCHGMAPACTAMMREIAAEAGNFRGVCPIIGRLRMSFSRQ